MLISISCNGSGQYENTKADKVEGDKVTEYKSNYNFGLKFNLLGLAVMDNDKKLIEKLISEGASLENAAQDDYNIYGALYVAIIENNQDMVRYLLEKKADVNAIYNEEGNTPLVAAIRLNNDTIVKSLLEKGAKQNTGFVIVPILEATIENNSKIIKLLMDYGADPNYKNNEGISAYDYAIKHNNSLLQFLKKTDNGQMTSFRELIVGNYRINCNDKQALIILDQRNAYLDLNTNNGFVRLVMELKQQNENYEIIFNDVAAITRRNIDYPWKLFSTQKPVATIHHTSPGKIDLSWIGFFNEMKM